jgi:hypothetical protein
MPKKSKQQIARSRAAKRGWETRRVNQLAEKRSRAAKRGWETRRLRDQAEEELGLKPTDRLPRNGLVRAKYQSKKRTTDYEIVRKKGKTTEIRINGKSYTREVDLQAFDLLISASKFTAR